MAHIFECFKVVFCGAYLVDLGVEPDRYINIT